jgi:RNA polymerase sigma factor (sigma-70 family)
MTQRPSDPELLRRASAGDRAAAGELVSRYVDFVYACALRQVRDSHLAEDVTQAAFVILLAKATRLPNDTILHAWLFNTTRYAAANALRMRARRARHERIAGRARREPPTREDVENPATPLLDDALAALREPDRRAVLLSYFAQQSWREVGAAIGVSEEAARKRVDRAVGKLRDYFARRGVSVSGASLAAIGHDAARVVAPDGLRQSVMSCAAAPAATASAASGLVKGAIQMMTWVKLKLAAAVAAGVLVTIGGAGAMALRSAGESAPNAPQPAEPAPLVATLADRPITVELLAVAQRDDPAKWWNADGSPSPEHFDRADTQDDPPLTHQVAVRMTTEAGAIVSWAFIGNGWSCQPATRDGAQLPDTFIVCCRPNEGADTLNLKMIIAAGPMKLLAVKHGPAGVFASIERGRVAFSDVFDVEGQATVSLTFDRELLTYHHQIVAIDAQGKEHGVQWKSATVNKDVNIQSVRFDLPAADVDRIEVRGMPYDRFILFKDVATRAGNATHPQVESGPTSQPSTAASR